MKKRFIEWIFTKIYTNTKERSVKINELEVYWCFLGENIGDEENGKGEEFRRPVLIFKKFNNNIFWGIPMSTKIKENRFYIKVVLKNIIQSAMISQLRLLDVKRLDFKIGYLSRKDFDSVEKGIINLILGNK